jgi:hypothetical protein
MGLLEGLEVETCEPSLCILYTLPMNLVCTYWHLHPVLSIFTSLKLRDVIYESGKKKIAMTFTMMLDLYIHTKS